jgi:hypothetical protein
MKAEEKGMKIVMQVGSEVRISNNGDVVLDNPELELVGDERAADAVLIYRFDPQAKVHVIRLLDPVADRKHMKSHHRND